MSTAEVVREMKIQRCSYTSYGNRGRYLIIYKFDLNPIVSWIYHPLFKTDHSVLFSPLLINLIPVCSTVIIYLLSQIAHFPLTQSSSLCSWSLLQCCSTKSVGEGKNQNEVGDYSNFLPALGIQASSRLQKLIITEIGLDWSSG